MDTGPRFRTAPRRHGLGPAAALFLTLGLLTPFGPARAESTNVEGPAAHAAGNLDFRIVIPKVLRLDASTGTFFTNAHPKETIVIAATGTQNHRSIASRSDPGSIRLAIDALTREAEHRPASYTVAMP